MQEKERNVRFEFINEVDKQRQKRLELKREEIAEMEIDPRIHSTDTAIKMKILRRMVDSKVSQLYKDPRKF